MATGTIKNTMLYVEQYNISNLAISAQSATPDSTLDITINGYQAIGIVGFELQGTGSSQCSAYKQNLRNQNTLLYRIRNNGDADVTITAIYKVLYQPI